MVYMKYTAYGVRAIHPRLRQRDTCERCGDRSGRESARQESSQLISTCREGSRGGNLSAGRPGCSLSVARASDERTPRVGESGESQGG
eukprot:5324197-Pleurochrysis_carterae.AAC.1